jgi:excisionase family DNA binding protein
VTTDFLTPDELGERLRESGRTIRRKAAAGLLPYYRLSHKVIRFRWAEVEAALARLRIPSRGESQ